MHKQSHDHPTLKLQTLLLLFFFLINVRGRFAADDAILRIDGIWGHCADWLHPRSRATALKLGDA